MSTSKTLLESYKLGDVQVEIHATEYPSRFKVDCRNDSFHSSFEVSEYEATHYRRHMNLKISKAFGAAKESE
jgi:hypothetical protein